MASSTPYTLKWGIMATGGIAQSTATSDEALPADPS